MNIKFVVELEPYNWLASWSGDPGRTLHLDNARLFDEKEKAERALKAARRYKPFRSAQVVPVSVVIKYAPADAKE